MEPKKNWDLIINSSKKVLESFYGTFDEAQEAFIKSPKNKNREFLDIVSLETGKSGFASN